MALNKSDLKDDLVAKIITPQQGDLSKKQKEDMTDFLDKIADAVDAHVKRGEVTVNHSGTGSETTTVQ